MNSVLGTESVNGLRRAGLGEGLMGRVRLRVRVAGRVERREGVGAIRSMLQTLAVVVVREIRGWV